MIGALAEKAECQLTKEEAELSQHLAIGIFYDEPIVGTLPAAEVVCPQRCQAIPSDSFVNKTSFRSAVAVSEDALPLGTPVAVTHNQRFSPDAVKEACIEKLKHLRHACTMAEFWSSLPPYNDLTTVDVLDEAGYWQTYFLSVQQPQRKLLILETTEAKQFTKVIDLRKVKYVQYGHERDKSEPPSSHLFGTKTLRDRAEAGLDGVNFQAEKLCFSLVCETKTVDIACNAAEVEYLRFGFQTLVGENPSLPNEWLQQIDVAIASWIS